MNAINKLFANFFLRIYNKVLRYRAIMQRSQFASCGENVRVGVNCDFIPSHIHIGNNVSIGSHASFLASISHIYIDDYVIFGPHVTIRGGDHRIDVIGKHIAEIGEDEKLSENDADVHIEGGSWIGCNVTILKGCTIGRGAVVAAGSVVTKNIPPYSIAAGIPARVIKYRFSPAEIELHESILKQRFSK